MDRHHTVKPWLPLSLVALAACGGSTPSDAGVDAPPHDANEQVGGDAGADVGVEDRDAEPADDAASDLPVDAGPIDAGPPVDAGAESCNRFDDDRDGLVDEGACRVCMGCAPCATDVRGDTTYITCDTPVLGVHLLQVWSEVCERIGPGYRLVDLDTPGEALVAEMRAGVLHTGIGLRSFGASATFVDSRGVPRDAAAVHFDPDSPRLEGDHCFYLTMDGVSQVTCLANEGVRRVICEGELAATLDEVCTPTEETCDGEDDDCDRRVDEGACDADCTATRFVGRVYHACSRDATWDQAHALCSDVGAVMSIPESGEEAFMYRYTAGFPTERGFGWIGFRNTAADGGVTPTWLDGRPVEPIPGLVWGPDEPTGGPDAVGAIQYGAARMRLAPPDVTYSTVCERDGD